MTAEEAKRILQQYLDDTCTAEEKALLESRWEKILAEQDWEVPAEQEALIRERLLSNIKTKLAEHTEQPASKEQPAKVRSILPLQWKIAAAAAAVLIIIIGIAYYQSQNRTQPAEMVVDIPPGGNHAMLTLANGRHILLDSAANGILPTQGAGNIIKQNDELVYMHKGQTAAGMNTLTTPKGGQYKLTLPDGTKVWLDAVSSITYPTAFTEKTRQVTLTGQAYFEVAHDAGKPFEVKAQGQTIRDIGTAFNINAYTDEPSMQITLSQGAVAVNDPKGHTAILKNPGQQIECQDGANGAITNVELNEVLAWKNGFINLTSANIATIMRQLSRWYDIDIQYQKGIPAGHITGNVPRNTNLSMVLDVLRTSGVHFTVDGRTIIVTP